MQQKPTPLKIYLASKSPRRQQLLQQIEVPFQLLDIDIDETPLAAESALETAQRLAEKKALTGWQHPHRTERIPVLAADTLGLLDGELLTKPVNKQDGCRMLAKMSARTHDIFTAVCICLDGEVHNIVSHSTVEFCNLSEQEIAAYWETGEAADKAGSYGIQGIGARFVKSISGSYSGIVGLPLHQTWQLLQKLRTE